jgi:hypothetical protein
VLARGVCAAKGGVRCTGTDFVVLCVYGLVIDAFELHCSCGKTKEGLPPDDR